VGTSKQVSGLLQALELQRVEGIEDRPALPVELFDALTLMREALRQLLHKVFIIPPHLYIQPLGKTSVPALGRPNISAASIKTFPI
jgi:hypothetical protein